MLACLGSSQDPSPSLLSFFAHPFPSPFPSVQLSSMNVAVAEISDYTKAKNPVKEEIDTREQKLSC